MTFFNFESLIKKFPSGVKTRNALRLKIFQLPSMETGIIGLNGEFALVHVVEEFLLKHENAIIQHQLMEAHFALVRELAIKHAAMIHALMINRVSEHNNVQRKTKKQSKDNSTRGCHT